jgi:C1A family cysteine protease
MKHLLNPLFLLGLCASILFSCQENKEDLEPQNEIPVNLGFVQASSNELRGIDNAPKLFMGNLPSSFFLAVPTPGNQGAQGSCTSWATGYTVASFFMNANKSSKYSSNADLASPSYIYNQIRKGGQCGAGSSYPDNLNILQNQGVCSLADMPYNPRECGTQPSTTQRNLAQRNKILKWAMINKNDLSNIKAYLYAGHPVMIAFYVDEGLNFLSPPYIWKQRKGRIGEGHAVVVIGYDDNKQAFKIQNSWGANWKDKGCFWIDYNFFPTVVVEAYVAYANININPPVSNGNLAIGGIASSSSGANPSAAFDGNLSTAWNSGRHAPVWISVDLRQNRTINRIRLIPSQLPDGNTTHQISVSSDMVNWRLVETFTLFTRSQVAFERTYSNPITNVRGIRVTTTQSPSWVAWHEIEVFGN